MKRLKVGNKVIIKDYPFTDDFLIPAIGMKGIVKKVIPAEEVREEWGEDTNAYIEYDERFDVQGWEDEYDIYLKGEPGEVFAGDTWRFHESVLKPIKTKAMVYRRKK